MFWVQVGPELVNLSPVSNIYKYRKDSGLRNAIQFYIDANTSFSVAFEKESDRDAEYQKLVDLVLKMRNTVNGGTP